MKSYVILLFPCVSLYGYHTFLGRPSSGRENSRWPEPGGAVKDKPGLDNQILIKRESQIQKA